MFTLELNTLAKYLVWLLLRKHVNGEDNFVIKWLFILNSKATQEGHVYQNPRQPTKICSRYRGVNSQRLNSYSYYSFTP